MGIMLQSGKIQPQPQDRVRGGVQGGGEEQRGKANVPTVSLIQSSSTDQGLDAPTASPRGSGSPGSSDTAPLIPWGSSLRC